MPTYQMTEEQSLIAVCQFAAVQLSLPKPTTVYASSDPNVQLLGNCANLASLELMNLYEWSNLIKTGEIMVYQDTTPPPSGSAVEKAYDLPEDWYRFIDQTQWNDSMRYPAVGPVSPQGWMTYLVFPISANFTLTWQIRERKIWFLNPPVAPGQKFRFMYLSRAIVRDADNADLLKNVATKDGDEFLLDGLLMQLLTRVKWLEAKGFDSSAALRDFMTAFDSRTGASKGANILNMAAQRGGYPYIGIGNLPDSSLYGMRGS